MSVAMFRRRSVEDPGDFSRSVDQLRANDCRHDSHVQCHEMGRCSYNFIIADVSGHQSGHERWTDSEEHLEQIVQSGSVTYIYTCQMENMISLIIFILFQLVSYTSGNVGVCDI